MQKIEGDTLRGHLEGMVLAALSRGEAHGFEVLRRLEELGCGALSLKEGTLYPVLYRLEEAGLVRAAWEDDSERPSRSEAADLPSDRPGPARAGTSSGSLGAVRDDRGRDLGGTNMIPSHFRDRIERVVGPVWASESRKDRMREELFAHLEASFEEERGHLGDDGAAADRAIQRLGEASELTRSLQDSVPWLERVFDTRLIPHHRLETWCRRRRDETLPHYAIRITTWMTAMIAGGDLIGAMVGAAVRSRPVDWPVVLVWGPATLAVIAVGTFVFPFLGEAMVRALQSESSHRYRAPLIAALSSLFVIALILGFVLIVTVGAPHGQVFRRADWLLVLVFALFAPPALFLARETPSPGAVDGTDGSSPRFRRDHQSSLLH